MRYRSRYLQAAASIRAEVQERREAGEDIPDEVLQRLLDDAAETLAEAMFEDAE